MRSGLVVFFGLCAFGPALYPQSPYRPVIPKTWDDAALADWATPLAGINVRPTHISEASYYSLPADNLRTYPVYARGREPQGYWDMVQRVGPKPMLEPESLSSPADWVEAGHSVFYQTLASQDARCEGR